MTVVIVLVIVAAVALLVAAIVVVWLRARARKARVALARELANDPAVRGPEPAIYRGCTGGYSQVNGNGRIVLTGRRLLFQKLVGSLVIVPRDAITGVGTARAFAGGVVGGRTHLVVHTRTGDVGFFVGDLDAWLEALRPGAG